MPCVYSAVTESSTTTFSYIISNYYNNAYYEVLARSGRGITRNYNSVGNDTLPTYYYKALTTDIYDNNTNNYWNTSIHSNFDMVIIGLGGNDYSTDPVPNDTDFIDTYIKFINIIQYDNPNAIIILLSYPHYSYTLNKNIETVSLLTNTLLIKIPKQQPEEIFGCDSHPSSSMQLYFANYIIDYINKITNWIRK
jgi:hypothetical protein